MIEDSTGWTLDEADVDVGFSDIGAPVKYLVLTTIDESAELGVTYREIAEHIGMPPKQASWYLTRYRRQGLITRDDDSVGAARHQLTEHGRARLEHFHESI